jgi:CheY-like chemotaxis protein
VKATAKQDVVDIYLKHLRVLLVDDSLPVQRMVQAVFRDVGVGEVLTASDGEQALEILDDKEIRIGLIISNWHMRKMTGLDLLRTIRDQGRNIPFLMVSSDVSKQTVTSAVAAGVNAYIRKPFSQKEITDEIVHIATAYG